MSVLVVKVLVWVELVLVESVVDSDIPSTTGGCNFFGGPVWGPHSFSEYLYLIPT